MNFNWHSLRNDGSQNPIRWLKAIQYNHKNFLIFLIISLFFYYIKPDTIWQENLGSGWSKRIISCDKKTVSEGIRLQTCFLNPITDFSFLDYIFPNYSRITRISRTVGSLKRILCKVPTYLWASLCFSVYRFHYYSSIIPFSPVDTAVTIYRSILRLPQKRKRMRMSFHRNPIESWIW